LARNLLSLPVLRVVSVTARTQHAAFQGLFLIGLGPLNQGLLDHAGD
jgi:hypothetical protein